MLTHADPFSLLNLPRSMDLDRSVIDAAYLMRAAEIHPDLDSGSAGEAQERMAALNHARSALADPESRAEALLTLSGGPAKESDTSLPPGFLMEFMETRQEIEAALDSGDAQAHDRWRGWVKSERSRYQAEVTQAFASRNLVKVRTLLNAWRYVERVGESLRQASAGGI